MHPVAAALANPNRTCLPLLATEQALATLASLLERYPASHLAQKRLAQATLVERQAIDKLHRFDTSHQSLSLKCSPLPSQSLASLIDSLGEKKTTTLVMLDRVQDPAQYRCHLAERALLQRAGSSACERACSSRECLYRQGCLRCVGDNSYPLCESRPISHAARKERLEQNRLRRAV